jgi:hypothetical protein
MLLSSLFNKKDKFFRDRLMVGHLTLTQRIEVRILVPKPNNGEHSVSGSTPLCERGSTGSEPVAHPKASVTVMVHVPD